MNRDIFRIGKAYQNNTRKREREIQRYRDTETERANEKWTGFLGRQKGMNRDIFMAGKASHERERQRER